jgi:hypothetical protein
MFDLSGEPIQAREASGKVFQKAGIESWEDDLHFAYDWQEVYLEELRKDPKGNANEISSITREKPLDDILQDPTMALIALLAAEFDDGIHGLYEAFSSAVEICQFDDVSTFLKNCMDHVLSKVRDQNRWDIVAFRDQYYDIPSGYTDIFPETVYLLEYVSEGLSMSLERIALAMVYAGNAQVRYTHMDYRLLFCSHVILPIQCETRGGATYQYALHEDFFFGRVSTGDDNGNFVYTSMEGRCIMTWGGSVFSKMNSKGNLNVRFYIEEFVRRFGQHQVLSMAKYQLEPSILESLYSSFGLTVDHLTKLTSFGQATLVMISDWYQQATNQRPRLRTFFQGQVLSPISHAFGDLEDDEKINIASSCKEKVGLPMVRLEEGYAKNIHHRMGDHMSPEIWAALVVDCGVLYFEDEQCIWQKGTDSWIFLKDLMKVTNRTRYRSLAIQGLQTLVSCTVAYTKLYAAFTSGKHHLSASFLHRFKLENIIRQEGDDVKIKAAWLDQERGAVHRIVVDHVNGDTRDNRPTNLRMVDSRENIILACGKSCQATIQRFDDADESLPRAVTVTRNSIAELAEILPDIMERMKYPERYQSYSQNSLRQYIRNGSFPGLEKVVFTLLANDRDMDNDDTMCESSKFWYVAIYQHHDGSTIKCVYRGKDSFIKDVKSKLALMQPAEYLSQNVFIGNSVFNKNVEYRRECLKGQMCKTKNYRKDGNYDLVDLYSSFHTSRRHITYDAYIPGIGECCGLKGYAGVIAKLRTSPQIEQFVNKVYSQGTGAANQVRLDQGWTIMVKSCVMLGKNSKLGREFPDLILRPSNDDGCRYVSQPGEKLLVKFQDGSETCLTFREISDLYNNGKQSDSQKPKSTVRSWVKNACDGHLCADLSNIGIVSIVRDPAARPKRNGEAEVQVEKIDSSTKPNEKQILSFTSKDAAVGYIFQFLSANRFGTESELGRYLDKSPEVNDGGGLAFKLSYTKKIRQAANEPVYLIADEQQLCAAFKGNDPLEKYTVSMRHALPNCATPSNHEEMTEEEFRNRMDGLFHGRSQKKVKYEDVKAGLEKKEMICLELLGYKDATDSHEKKSLSSFLRYAMGIEKKTAEKNARSFENGPGAPRKVPVWYRVMFTARNIETAFIERVIKTEYRAFLIVVDKKSTEDIVSVIRLLIQDKICGTGQSQKESTDGFTTKEKYTIMREDLDWRESTFKKQGFIDHFQRTVANDIHEQVWKDFGLQGKKVALASKATRHQWIDQKVASKAVSPNFETGKKQNPAKETMHLESAEIPTNSEHIPFRYVFLEKKHLEGTTNQIKKERKNGIVTKPLNAEEMALDEKKKENMAHPLFLQIGISKSLYLVVVQGRQNDSANEQNKENIIPVRM